MSSHRTAHRVGLDLEHDSRSASTLRIVVSSLAADAGFSIDEIDDLQLGVSEVFNALIAANSRPPSDDIERIVVAVTIGEREVQAVFTSAASSDDRVEFDDLAVNILNSVVDSVDIGAGAVTLIKRASETSA